MNNIQTWEDRSRKLGFTPGEDDEVTAIVAVEEVIELRARLKEIEGQEPVACVAQEINNGSGITVQHGVFPLPNKKIALFFKDPPFGASLYLAAGAKHE